MSEMIERAASALYEASDRGTPKHEWATMVAQCEPMARLYRSLAVAAVKVMRDPTEAMLEAGSTQLPEPIWGTPDEPRDVWFAMIDAALS